MVASTPVVSRADVEAAAARIRGHVRRTPTIAVEASTLCPGEVRLKLDLLQPSGSFKARGAAALLTAVDVGEAGVVAASGGNFGLAICWAAARLGVAATVFVPASSPASKLDALASTGARIEIVEGYYADALAASRRYIERTGALGAHAYDQAEVVAGQATLCLEIMDGPPVDTVLVACGGGGLAAGLAVALGEDVRLVIVETYGTPTFARAFDAGGPVDVEVSGIAASSLGARRLGQIAWSLRERIDEHVLVDDDAVRDAQRLLWQHVRIVAEPGGAAALAALSSGAYVPRDGERVLAIVCGGNSLPGEVV